MNIGQRIKTRRLELNMSVDELATKIGKNRATVYRYESNDIEDLPTSILEPLSKALQTTPGYLMGWEDNEKSPTEESEELDNVYFSLAKDAQQNGIDPDDIRLAIETIKSMKNRKAGDQP